MSFGGESVEDAQPPARETFSVGKWRVEPDRLRLSSGAEEHRLEPKVMEVLVVLAQRPGVVVPRQALQEAVWSPHASEDLPRRAIHALRKAFGDDPKKGRYIETVPRVGYRLVAPVERDLAVEAAEASSLSPSAPGSGNRLRWPLLALLLTVAALAGWWWMARTGSVGREERRASAGPQEQNEELRLSPLTSQPGLEYDPAFSPDGSRVAFVRAPSDRVDAELSLQVQLLGDESALRLSEAPATFSHPIASPAWAPDGTTLAYLRWQPEEGWGIYEISALGGSERRRFLLGRAGASGLAWAPDGSAWVLGLRSAPGEPYALHRIVLGEDPLTARAITTPPAGSGGDQAPAFSRDGRRLAFKRTLGPDAAEIRWLDADDQIRASLLPEPTRIADLDWIAGTDGEETLLVSLYEAGRYRLWTLDPETGERRRWLHSGDDARWLSASGDGRRVVLTETRWDFQLWRYPLTQDGEGGVGRPLPDLSSTFHDEGLALSSDDRLLALASTRSGASEIWTVDLENGTPIRRTFFDGAALGHPRWLPGKLRLLFQANPGGRFQIYEVGLEGAPPRPLFSSPHSDRAPSPSRDGEAVYFASDRSGSWEIWRWRRSTGESERITEDGGYYGQESPDGRFLYFTRFQRDGLWRLPLEAGRDSTPERVLADEPRSWEWGNWAVREAGIYLVDRDGAGQEYLSLYDPESGERLRRLEMTGTPVQPSLAVSATGEWALVAQLDGIESDLVIFEPRPPPP